jgi:hypothetical protein
MSDVSLVPLCHFDVGFGEVVDTGSGPHGRRLIGETASLSVTGERLAGEMAGNAAADWLLIGADGRSGTVDVREAVRTHDGALIYVRYHGRLDVSTIPTGPPFFVSALFETGDERYAWLNHIVAVGRGTFRPDLSGLDYDFYELVDGAA